MTFFFYDLETSSGSSRDGRIMQFAGQRTDEELKPIGEPYDILIKLSDDVIPEPDAVLVHGITPQKTLEEGVTEAEFAKIFSEEIATPNTTFVGYNNIRFDDEFTRRILYRTFYDPYQWHWKNGCSRWDLLDPIRMMRALRPEGLKWPEIDGKPTVKLELMAKENDLEQETAHDALSDVTALLELAQKFKSAQPKLYNYLVQTRDKKKVSALALSGEPFVYTSGKYSSKNEKTTVVVTLFKHPRRDGAVVYDLRKDPEKWADKSVDELLEHWQARYDQNIESPPYKTIMFNKCPAVAPLGVLDQDSQKRINIDTGKVNSNHKKLKANTQLVEKLKEALDKMENAQQTSLELDDSVDNQIYDGFWGESDQREMEEIRSTDPESLHAKDVKNARLRDMLPLYKARNYPKSMTEDERKLWEEHRIKALMGGGENSKITKFTKRMAEIPKQRKLNAEQEYLLTELQLYVESILPEVDD